MCHNPALMQVNARVQKSLHNGDQTEQQVAPILLLGFLVSPRQTPQGRKRTNEGQKQPRSWKKKERINPPPFPTLLRLRWF